MSILQVTEKETQLQRELDEERRLNSMGSEREYILHRKIARLRREIDRLRAAFHTSTVPLPAMEALMIDSNPVVTVRCYSEAALRDYGDRRAIAAAAEQLEALIAENEQLCEELKGAVQPAYEPVDALPPARK